MKIDPNVEAVPCEDCDEHREVSANGYFPPSERVPCPSCRPFEYSRFVDRWVTDNHGPAIFNSSAIRPFGE